MAVENIKWMNMLRKQKREDKEKFDKMQLEYEALLLTERSRNEWLHCKLIDAQKKVRTLTYEIMKKEEALDALRTELRGTAQLRRSTPKEETVPAGVSGAVGDGSQNIGEHNLAV